MIAYAFLSGLIEWEIVKSICQNIKSLFILYAASVSDRARPCALAHIAFAARISCKSNEMITIHNNSSSSMCIICYATTNLIVYKAQQTATVSLCSHRQSIASCRQSVANKQPCMRTHFTYIRWVNTFETVYLIPKWFVVIFFNMQSDVFVCVYAPKQSKTLAIHLFQKFWIQWQMMAATTCCLHWHCQHWLLGLLFTLRLILPAQRATTVAMRTANTHLEI